MRKARLQVRQRYVVLVVLLVTGMLGGCAIGPLNLGQINLVSLEDEWVLGARLERDLARELRIVNDPAVNAYINQLGQQMVRETQLGHLPWKFHVVADPSVNAFNIPGGHVYVNTGLIAASRNVSELSAVMGHEIAHGVARHGTKRLTKAYGLSIVTGLVLGQNPAIYEQILAQFLSGAAFARFSRDDEREADRLGIRYMYRAGYNPNGMASMFENILDERRRRPSTVEQFFATHPLTEDRIAAAQRLARELPPKNGLITNDAGLRNVQQRISRFQ